MRRRLPLGVPALCALVLTALPGRPSADVKTGGTPRPMPPMEKGAPYMEREQFPPFKGKTWRGEPFDLASHYNKGKYILVDFWATWCGPCMAEMPNMVRTMVENQNERFEILTVSFDKEGALKDMERVVDDYGLTFPIVTEWKHWKSSWVEDYEIKYIPQNFLLDPTGRVLMRDLHGEAMVDITRAFAMRPDLKYEPILLEMEILNPPAKPTKESPETPVEPLQVKLQVWNPQVPQGTFEVGIEYTAYTDSGVQTLRKKADGTFTMDQETGKPRVFQQAVTVSDTVKAEGSNGYAEVTLTIPMPAGTMDGELVPFAYSPALGMTIYGTGEYPTWSTRTWMDEEALAKQGGVIPPESAPAEEPAPEPTQG
ncbi:MAG TPA: redoxin domain-containing protein [bacterium]|nr:redoxin domain-containing protein [bacterium]